MELQDNIREGDGVRVLNCWRYLMILFKATGHRNYAIETFTALAQHKWLLPQRQAMQLQYSRFINTHGYIGCNIPSDLYMEHLNRFIKCSIKHLGPNKTKQCIQRIGRCIGIVDEIMTSFDNENNVATTSLHHSAPLIRTDLENVIKELLRCDVFSMKPGREHKFFKEFNCNIMKTVNKQKATDWMKTQYTKLINLLAMQS